MADHPPVPASAYLPVRLGGWLSADLSACLSTWLPAYLPTRLPCCLPDHRAGCQPACWLARLACLYNTIYAGIAPVPLATLPGCLTCRLHTGELKDYLYIQARYENLPNTCRDEAADMDVTWLHVQLRFHQPSRKH